MSLILSITCHIVRNEIIKLSKYQNKAKKLVETTNKSHHTGNNLGQNHKKNNEKARLRTPGKENICEIVIL